jgi:uncharacterized GH25 family protein
MKSGLRMAWLLLVPIALVAHDTWLVPMAFRVEPGKTVKVRLATSEAFPTSDSAVGPERVEQFFVRDSRGVTDVKCYRVEDKFLVAEVTPARAGHTIVVAETKPRLLVLEPKQFSDYLRAEELKAVIDARAKTGEKDAPGRERYRKIAKAAVCAGDARDDAYREVEGLWLEIVLLKSPCNLRVGDRLEVQVLHLGNPLIGTRLAVGYQGPTGHNYPIWTETNAKGRALIEFDRPGAWFLRTLHMVRARGDTEADWHSAFSTVTFEVLPKR